MVIDEALDTLRGEARGRVFAVLEKDLEGSAIVNIGRAQPGITFFSRELHLAIDPHGHTIRPIRLDTAASRQPTEAEQLRLMRRKVGGAA